MRERKDKNRQKNEQCNIEPLTPSVSQDTLSSSAFPIETLISLLFIPQFLEKLASDTGYLSSTWGKLTLLFNFPTWNNCSKVRDLRKLFWLHMTLWVPRSLRKIIGIFVREVGKFRTGWVVIGCILFPQHKYYNMPMARLYSSAISGSHHIR